MSELREDYVLDRWVIISEKRGKRPHQFKEENRPPSVKECFFCPGKEDMTPTEIGRIGTDRRWKIRWFPNKFAAVEETGTFGVMREGILVHQNAYGSHEVIVETNDHDKQLHDLSREHIKQIIEVYDSRIEELEKHKGIKYVTVFKNHGPHAGTSIEHSHSQVISLDRVPSILHLKAKRSIRWNRCRYCEVIKHEIKSPRMISETKNFVSFCPYASVYNYEASIFPKRHFTRLSELSKEEYLECAGHIKKIISKLGRNSISYNMFVHYAPRGTKLHLHIEITPRISVFAGFEISTGTYINSVSPESAAEFYRMK